MLSVVDMQLADEVLVEADDAFDDVGIFVELFVEAATVEPVKARLDAKKIVGNFMLQRKEFERDCCSVGLEDKCGIWCDFR